MSQQHSFGWKKHSRKHLFGYASLHETTGYNENRRAHVLLSWYSTTTYASRKPFFTQYGICPRLAASWCRMAPNTPPAKITKGAPMSKTTAIKAATENTMASAVVVMAASHRMIQAAPTNPMAVALTPLSVDLNHRTCRRRAQKGAAAKMRITPGPKIPRNATIAPGDSLIDCAEIGGKVKERSGHTLSEAQSL